MGSRDNFQQVNLGQKRLKAFKKKKFNNLKIPRSKGSVFFCLEICTYFLIKEQRNYLIKQNLNLRLKLCLFIHYFIFAESGSEKNYSGSGSRKKSGSNQVRIQNSEITVITIETVSLINPPKAAELFCFQFS